MNSKPTDFQNKLNDPLQEPLHIVNQGLVDVIFELNQDEQHDHNFRKSKV
jgi:hypothetical protein